MISLIALGLGAMLDVGCGDNQDNSSIYKDDDFYDIPYTCTDEWRSIHPFGYNPVTGGSTEEDDESNGW